MFFHLCEALNSVLLNNAKPIFVTNTLIYEIIIRKYEQAVLKFVLIKGGFNYDALYEFFFDKECSYSL